MNALFVLIVCIALLLSFLFQNELKTFLKVTVNQTLQTHKMLKKRKLFRFMSVSTLQHTNKIPGEIGESLALSESLIGIKDILKKDGRLALLIVLVTHEL